MDRGPYRESPGLSANDLVAQVAHEELDPGPMGWDVRRADYLAFCERNFVDGGGAGVFGSGGTNCAIFARGCLVQAGVMPRAGRPSPTAITTWLGLSFSHRSWLRFDGTGLVLGHEEVVDEKTGRLVKRPVRGYPLPGEIFYICSNTGSITVGGRTYTWTSWTGALNGHVGVVLPDGSEWSHPTAEGGGRRHTCRKSDGPKDLRRMGRTLQGVWRPLAIASDWRPLAQ